MKKFISFLGVAVLCACQNPAEKEHVTSNVNSKQRIDRVFSKIENFKVKPQIFEINPLVDTSISIGSQGTKIHIPSNAFVDNKGQNVTSKIAIEFTEYKNSAEIAFSGISMVYYENNQIFNFNSSGMFEINGTARGSKVHIKPNKTLKIDYLLAKKNNDISFFKLNSQNKWEKSQDIKPENPKIISIQRKISLGESKLEFDVVGPKLNNYTILWFDKKGKRKGLPEIFSDLYKPSPRLIQYLQDNPKYYLSIKFSLDTITGKLINARSHPRNPTKIYDAEIINILQDLPKCVFIRNSGPAITFNDKEYELIIDLDTTNLPAGNTGIDVKDDGNRSRGTLLAPGMGAGHTYPDIIRGLNISTFGVYNCDQIYHVPNRIDIVAKYVDESNTEIVDLTVLSLIDLNYNGAFSFPPNLFTCSATGKNTLLLFSRSGQLYILDFEEFDRMNIKKGGEYTFKLRNVTESIKNTSDLTKYLRLDI